MRIEFGDKAILTMEVGKFIYINISICPECRPGESSSGHRYKLDRVCIRKSCARNLLYIFVQEVHDNISGYIPLCIAIFPSNQLSNQPTAVPQQCIQQYL